MCTKACREGEGGQVQPLSPEHWDHFEVHREDITIEFEGETHVGKLVCAKDAEPKPIVLVCHNYAGLKFFDEHQAEYMARLGYVGLAIDMYGNSHPHADRIYPEEEPQPAGKMT